MLVPTLRRRRAGEETGVGHGLGEPSNTKDAPARADTGARGRCAGPAAPRARRPPGGHGTCPFSPPGPSDTSRAAGPFPGGGAVPARRPDGSARLRYRGNGTCASIPGALARASVGRHFRTSLCRAGASAVPSHPEELKPGCQIPLFLQSAAGCDRGCQLRTAAHLNGLVSQRCCVRRILSPGHQTRPRSQKWRLQKAKSNR